MFLNLTREDEERIDGAKDRRIAKARRDAVEALCKVMDAESLLLAAVDYLRKERAHYVQNAQRDQDKGDEEGRAFQQRIADRYGREIDQVGQIHVALGDAKSAAFREAEVQAARAVLRAARQTVAGR